MILPLHAMKLPYAVGLYRELHQKYGGTIDFHTICHDHNILFEKAHLSPGVTGFSIRVNGTGVIIMNASVKRLERHAYAWHELYHLLRGCAGTFDNVISRREEHQADLFAALCMIPEVQYGDTPHCLVERHSVPVELATLRIEQELRMNQAA